MSQSWSPSSTSPAGISFKMIFFFILAPLCFLSKMSLLVIPFPTRFYSDIFLSKFIFSVFPKHVIGTRFSSVHKSRQMPKPSTSTTILPSWIPKHYCPPRLCLSSHAFKLTNFLCISPKVWSYHDDTTPPLPPPEHKWQTNARRKSPRKTFSSDQTNTSSPFPTFFGLATHPSSFTSWKALPTCWPVKVRKCRVLLLQLLFHLSL